MEKSTNPRLSESMVDHIHIGLKELYAEKENLIIQMDTIEDKLAKIMFQIDLAHNLLYPEGE